MDEVGGVRFDEAVTMMMTSVDERIRVEEEGDARVAHLFRRMAEDMSAGESATPPGGPVLVAAAD